MTPNDPAAIYAALAVGIICGLGLVVVAAIQRLIEEIYAKKKRDKFGYK